MSTYGYGRETTPGLTGFAAANVLFENARSQASCTFPSANSLLTSRYPANFLGQPDDALGIPAEIPTVASMFSAAGYRTAAISASPIVREQPSAHNPHGGFGAGFESFDETCQWREAACVNNRASKVLGDGDGRPLFLYLHYMDPHDPYNPPASYERAYATRRPALEFIAVGDPNPIADMLSAKGPEVEVTDRDVEHLQDLYDDEIRYFDEEFSHMLATLEAALGDDTVIVVTSDHGEEFLEHGGVKHCHGVFDTDVRTPLIMKLPGADVPQRTTRPAQNLDIVPTILDYAGIPHAPSDFDGRSLRPAIEQRRSPETYAYSAQGATRSIATERYKLILDLSDLNYMLFDVRRDPGEAADIASGNPQVLARMTEEMGTLLQTAEAGSSREHILRLEAQTMRRLRALGYLR